MRYLGYTVPGKNPILEPRKLVHHTRVVFSQIMAPAALLSPGPIQSPCPSHSAATKWQPRRLLCSESALTRASPHGNMDGASVKSSISFRPLDCVFGRRRMYGFGPETRRVSSRHVFTAAAQGSFAVNETQSSAPGNGDESSEKNAESVPAAAAPPPAMPERFRPRIPGQKARRENPTVPVEALVEGAVFTGKVTSIQSFGAFVNFGAFTDGLVHISKLSAGYVNNVSDIVKLGQEVKVTILNFEQSSGRIALSMVQREERTSDAREGSERSRFQQGSDGRPVNRGRIAGGGMQNRRDESQMPPTKLSKGQEVEGTVKNKIRSGVFVELPENEEGFLRYSDMPGGDPESSLQTGEKIKATVLRIDRGRIALTMNPVVDISNVNRGINEGKDSDATSPFELGLHGYNRTPADESAAYPKSFAMKTTVTPAEDMYPLNFFKTSVDTIPGQSAPKTEAVGVEDPIDEEGVSLESIRQIAAWLKESPAAAEEAPAEKQSVPEATASPVEEIFTEKEALAPVEASTVDEVPAESVPTTQAAVGDDPVDEEGVSLESIRQISAWIKESRAESKKAPAEKQSAQESAAPVAEE